MSQSPNDNQKPPYLIPWKPVIYAFTFVFLSSLLFLKPYLPRAAFYNFAKLYDYKHFPNRIIRTGKSQPWEVNANSGVSLPPTLDHRLTEIGTTAVVVIQNGKIAFEKYEGDGGVNTLSGSFSMAKSIISLLTGFAIQDKAITNVNEPVATYLPEWGNVTSIQTEFKPVTIKDLLTMTTGLNWNESYYNPFGITTEAYYGDDLYRTALKQWPVHQPGTVFAYHSGASQLLGMVVSRAVKRTLAEYASEKLWIPLGAETEALWSLDHEDGLEKAFCCVNATARDFARIGQLVLQKGAWNGTQLLNADYIAEMEKPHLIPNAKGEPTDFYGYQWWIEQTDQGPVPYARGILGQYIIVVPQKNAVVVRLGHHRGDVSGHTYDEVKSLIAWALHDFK